MVCILTHFTVSSTVLQMTGRKGRVVSNDDGSITYESRSELDVPVEILNLTEKQRFMDGEKVKTQQWVLPNMRFGAIITRKNTRTLVIYQKCKHEVI